MKETIIQFGTGNFLRGFFCDFINTMNEKGLYNGKIVIVQPTRGGKTEIINSQNGEYNLYLRGIQNGEEVCEHKVIKSVSRGVDPYNNYYEYLALAENPEVRFIVSNTTESGIEFNDECKFEDEPAISFPGKLTQLLYHRYSKGHSGFVLLPCELIDNNGDALKEYVLKYAQLWSLGNDFIEWINRENTFCNTLVDRIVTGYPKVEAEKLNTEIGYEDKLLNTAELFHLWVIEGDFENELPLKKAGLNVVWTDNVKPYKRMKVGILNGAHTSLVFPSLLCGVKTVGESIRDEQLKGYLDVCLSKYILPVLGESEENIDFADAVLERFANPYIKHSWKAISLNSVSKYSVRVLPTLLEYIEKANAIPKPLAFSLACLIEYYKTQAPQDNENVVTFIRNNDLTTILSSVQLWGHDLSCLYDVVNEGVDKIQKTGIREAISWAIM